MPAVRHTFNDDGGGRFRNAVCWTKCHFTRSAVSFLEGSAAGRAAYGDANKLIIADDWYAARPAASFNDR